MSVVSFALAVVFIIRPLKLILNFPSLKHQIADIKMMIITGLEGMQVAISR